MPLPSSLARFDAGRRDILEQLADSRDSRGFWSGQVSSSPLATAASIGALALAERHVDENRGGAAGTGDWLSGVLMRAELSELVGCSLRWLASQQNADGGWGDYAGAVSRLDATMAVEAAFQLTGVPARCNDMLCRTRKFVAAHGGVAALRETTGERRPVAAGVLTLYAAAGLASWKKTPAKLATLTMATAGRGGKPLTAAAVARETVLAAVGVARAANVNSPQPLRGLLSAAAKSRAVDFLADQQANSGGYLDSPLMTALVAGALASGDVADRQLVRRGVEFLLATVHADGSWPAAVDTAVRDTAACVAAANWNAQLFATTGSCNGYSDSFSPEGSPAPAAKAARQTLDWLLRRQQTALIDGKLRRTGWSWTPGEGAGSSVYDTASALLALAQWTALFPTVRTDEVRLAATAAVDWILSPQGPAGMSRWRRWLGRDEPGVGADATALMLRALHACRRERSWDAASGDGGVRLDNAIAGGLRELAAAQHSDGSWPAARYGNATYPNGANPVAGVSQAVRACCELGLASEEMTQRGIQWLVDVQHASGGWGPAPQPAASYAKRQSTAAIEAEAAHCTVEETALAVSALAAAGTSNLAAAEASALGGEWLADVVLGDAHKDSRAASIAFWGVWYHHDAAADIAAADALSALAWPQGNNGAPALRDRATPQVVASR